MGKEKHFISSPLFVFICCVNCQMQEKRNQWLTFYFKGIIYGLYCPEIFILIYHFPAECVCLELSLSRVYTQTCHKQNENVYFCMPTVQTSRLSSCIILYVPLF